MEIKSYSYLLFAFLFFIGSECNENHDEASKDVIERAYVSEVGQQINEDLFAQSVSHMFQVVKDPDDLLIEKLKKLSIPTLRFPGGTGSNYYHFYEKGYGFNSEDIALSKEYPPYDKMMVRLFREEKFIQTGFATENYASRFSELVEELNSSVLLVLNIFTGSDVENLDLIRFFSEKGINIRGVEFGNENYFRSFGSEFPDAKEYIHRCKQLTRKIKLEFPGLPVAVTAANCPFASHRGLQKRFSDWNNDLAEEDFYDAIVVHFYVKTPECDKIQDIDQKFECAKEKCLMDSRNWIEVGLDYYSNTFPDRKIWLTEFNIKEVYKQYGNSVLQGLYAANFLIDMTKSNKIDMAVYHVLFTNSFGFAMLSNAKNGPIERVSYKIFELFSEVDSTYKTVEIPNLDLQSDKVNSLILYSDIHSRHLLYFVNFENEEWRLDLPKHLEGSNIQLSSIHSDKLSGSLGRNAFVDSEENKTVGSHSEKIMKDQISLKPYSFSLLTIE